MSRKYKLNFPTTKIISVINDKGGSGKTTVVTNLAAELAKSNKVAVLDTDPNINTQKWMIKRGEYELPNSANLSLHVRNYERMKSGMFREIMTDLKSVAQEKDVVIADTPSNSNGGSRALMVLSDLILIPIMPGHHDVETLQKTTDFLEEALILAEEFGKPRPQVRLFLNRCNKTLLFEETKEALKDNDYQLMKSVFGARTIFGTSGCGLSVDELKKDKLASQELEGMVKEVISILKENN